MSYILLINSLLYASILIYLCRRKNTTGKNICILIVGLFFISSICSLLYYESPLYSYLSEKKNEISICALLYIFLGLWIYCRPLFNYQIDKTIAFPRIGKSDVFFYLLVFLGIIAIIPFLENIISLSKMGATDFADVYYEKMSDDYDSRAQFSYIGRLCNGITSWFQYITPVGVFYMIIKKKKWYWILLSFFAMLNPVLGSMNQGGRGPLFQAVCILTFNFFIFKKYFSPTLNKKIKTYAIIILSFLAAILFFITFARAAGDDNLAINQIYRYLGEGFVNFSETGWYVDRHTLGHSCINGTGFTFFKDISTYFDSRDYEGLSDFTRIRMYVYYTVFGDYFIDFGIIGGIIFNSLIAWTFYSFIKNRFTNISSIIAANIYAKIGFNGIYCFAYMARFEFVFFTIVCILILRHFENRYQESVFVLYLEA